MILQVEVSFAVAAPQEANLDVAGCKGTSVINVSMTNENQFIIVIIRLIKISLLILKNRANQH
jgi:hypothetical protein